MADALISAILNHVVDILIEEGKKQVKLLTELDDEVLKLRTNLNTIHALLEDADEKQVTDKLVRIWLYNLKGVYYDMDDVLDEWRTVLLMPEDGYKAPQKASAGFGQMVCSFLSCCSPAKLVTRRDLAVKIREINARLDEVTRDKDKFQLTQREIRQQHRRRAETSSFVDAAKLHGRDEIMETIVQSLCLDDEADQRGSDPLTISIVGMGGIGKTALAQKIYNNESLVGQCFEKRIWVCVSDLFEEIGVAKAIIVGLEGLDSNSVYLLDTVPLQALLERICTAIDGKRFFLVLDDVWTEDDKDFESLKCTFKHGASGSKILVTTRKDGVAMMMESSQVFHLEGLSQEDCWLVLSQAAFRGRNDRKEHENLEGIGRQIARKCKGLPLAAKTIGSLLRGKKSREEWGNVLNSEVWKLDIAQRDIFVPLLLSYYDLPLKIRQCFVYCAAYPKDFVIWSTHLIHQWMALGYLNLEGNPEMEVVGREYFNYLADCSFFQDFTYDWDGSIQACKMHDIVHDFALYLAQNELVTKNISPDGGLLLNLTHEKAHYLTIMVAKGIDFPLSISGTEKLRSIITFSGEHAITTKALQNVATSSKRLRSLDFSWPLGDHLGREIPSEIGKLLHLRHLNLAGSSMIQELPETICDLINLIYLDLLQCTALERLPEGIGKLVNLRFFRTTACYKLSSYPKGVGKLTSLRTLKNVIVRIDGDDPQEFSIADLGKLTKLWWLFMILKGERIDIGEARKAEFDKKKHLLDLRIRLGGYVKENEVIEALSPPSTSTLRFCSHARWYY